MAGGALLYSSFLADRLVDELYLNIVSVLTGPGINVSAADNAYESIELVNSSKLSDKVVQLHFEIAN